MLFAFLLLAQVVTMIRIGTTDVNSWAAMAMERSNISRRKNAVTLVMRTRPGQVERAQSSTGRRGAARGTAPRSYEV